MKAKSIRTLREYGDSDLSQGHNIYVPAEPWAPRLVADALVWAIKAAQRAIKSGVPRGVVTAWPAIASTLADRAEWPEAEKEPARSFRPDTPKAISRMEDALLWQSRYLRDGSPPAVLLREWLRSRAHRTPFTKAARALGWSPASAYRYRDKGLSIIATGLTRDRVKVWRP